MLSLLTYNTAKSDDEEEEEEEDWEGDADEEESDDNTAEDTSSNTTPTPKRAKLPSGALQVREGDRPMYIPPGHPFVSFPQQQPMQTQPQPYYQQTQQQTQLPAPIKILAKPTTINKTEQDKVYSFLENLHLQQYAPVLITNGTRLGSFPLATAHCF